MTNAKINRYRRKRPKVDASIFDLALSHTRRSDAAKKREENSVSTFGRFPLWTSFESSPVSVKIKKWIIIIIISNFVISQFIPSLVTLSIVNEKNGNSRRSSAGIMSEKEEFSSCETSKISQFSPQVAFIQEVGCFFVDTLIAKFFSISSVVLPKASGRIFFAENFWIEKIALKKDIFK